MPLATKRQTTDNRSGFVVDGAERIHSQCVSEVAKRVRERYAADLADANWWGCIRLRFIIRREIQRELHKLAPPSALYAARK